MDGWNSKHDQIKHDQTSFDQPANSQTYSQTPKQHLNNDHGKMLMNFDEVNIPSEKSKNTPKNQPFSNSINSQPHQSTTSGAVGAMFPGFPGCSAMSRAFFWFFSVSASLILAFSAWDGCWVLVGLWPLWPQFLQRTCVRVTNTACPRNGSKYFDGFWGTPWIKLRNMLLENIAVHCAGHFPSFPIATDRLFPGGRLLGIRGSKAMILNMSWAKVMWGFLGFHKWG